jgi:phospholipid N-methyltransferase
LGGERRDPPFYARVMPDLDTTIHVDMLNRWRERDGVSIYGMQWGDPDLVPPLLYTKQRFVDPYVTAGKTGLEIGPGGGRWTRYLLGFDKLYVVDFHQELLDEFARNVTADNVIRVRNNGTDFPGVPERSIDYVFSFGTFVHLNAHVITQYLVNKRAILAPQSSVVLHYSDKNKVMARENIGFAEMDPERMRQLIAGAGYRIVEEDTTSMWHSAVIRFTVEEHVH